MKAPGFEPKSAPLAAPGEFRARVAGAANLIETPPQTVSEDFSFYQQQIPGLYFFLGIRRPGASPDEFAPNHSPRFKIDESGLQLGVRALANLTVDYQAQAH